jgi:uncharacterized protein YbjT (DUF2867 family)
MKVILFGATGMVGQGALRECLLDADVARVLAVGRSATGQTHDKLRDVVLADPSDLTSLAAELPSVDACLFCLGVSAAGMSEADYRKVTFDLTLKVARALVEANPKMTFIYVSGAGTDGTARGRTMWARVKGETENALLALPFAHAFMFRPALIQPLHGIRSRTPLYRAVYAVLGPILPMTKSLLPGQVTTTEIVGRAMLRVAKHGASEKVLENLDINQLGKA